jgi:tetratricopeptide (TPR) repeat protein
LAGADAALDLKFMRAAALLDNDASAAAREAAKLLQEHPGHQALSMLLGTALRSCGQDPRAVEIFEALAAAQPNSASIQLELGRTLRAQGRQTQALGALTRAVQLQPNLAEAWGELSAVHAAAGDSGACDAAYAHYARLTPPDQHLADAQIAINARRFGAASLLLRRRLEQAPQDIAALRMLAEVAAEQEDYVEAERLLEEALRIAPGCSDARFDLARVLYSQQKAGPILAMLDRLLRLDPGDLHYRSLLAAAYGLLGLNDQSIEILSKLIDEHPRDERLWLAYGHSFRTAGRSREAVDAYRKCIALRPGFGEAWFSLANLKTFRFSADDRAAMLAQIARDDIPDNDRLQFEFALGKVLEDSREFAESFAHYARGNALRRAMVIYDGGGNTALVERSKALYTREFFAARAGSGCQSTEPIFIVGLPRSGSTLLEQILASHSQVEGTRELPDVPGFALELGAREVRGERPTYPESVARLSRAELNAFGERYLSQARPNRLLGKPYFIDKMPSNFFHVGLIQLILPNARIIDARRSPLGCCFANFKQHFQSGVWFTYSLRDLGIYYRDYVGLMRHFDTAMPGRIHRVQYEQLVANPETEIRAVLSYCGLSFEEQCLRFHETRRVVQTASSEQVRRPLYAESVDQWRNYEPWLGELKEALGDVLDR